VKNNSWNGRERNLLFVNLGNGKYSDAARPMGCDEIEESRAVALTDLDRDGRLDIVMNNNDAPPTIYLNKLPDTGNWCHLTLRGAALKEGEYATSRDALGAQVIAEITDGAQTKKIVRELMAGSGYAAQGENAMHLGLGNGGRLTSLHIKWPSGREVTLKGDEAAQLANGFWSIEEGLEKQLRNLSVEQQLAQKK